MNKITIVERRIVDKWEYIKEILLKTKRDNIKKLIDWLEEKKFYEAYGSTRFHGNYKGGLMDHSFNLFLHYNEECNKHNLKLDKESIIITSLLHDVCKLDLYEERNGIIMFNEIVGKMGHAQYSIQRITRFIHLFEKEKKIIQFHMGMYGTKEFWYEKGEYTLKELSEAFKDKSVKLFHFSDDIVTQFIDISK